MAYILYLDGVPMPVTPSKIQTKIKNLNKVINLINESEVNILKDAGLTEISFDLLIPQVRYPFGIYPDGFKDASYYLNKLEKLKTNKIPFQFLCSRTSPSGKLLFDTNIKVSLEDYDITEDAKEGLDISISIKLKQFKDYGTKIINIDANGNATVISSRSNQSAPTTKTYKVVSGDTLWNIAKKYLGDGSRWPEIYELNKDKITDPNTIEIGQILTLP